MTAALLAGLLAGVASLPHCAGMCGPLGAAACAGQARGWALSTYLGARLFVYSSLGAVAGATGGSLANLLGAQGATFLSVLVAVGLLASAVRMWPRRPKTTPLVQLRRSRGDSRPPRWAPLALGLATGFLPCGVLLAALLIAAGTGSAASGSLAMAAFAVSTSVALAAMTFVADRLETEGGLVGRRIIAAVLVAGALLTALRPLTVSGGAACHDPAAMGAPSATETLP